MTTKDISFPQQVEELLQDFSVDEVETILWKQINNKWKKVVSGDAEYHSLQSERAAARLFAHVFNATGLSGSKHDHDDQMFFHVDTPEEVTGIIALVIASKIVGFEECKKQLKFANFDPTCIPGCNEASVDTFNRYFTKSKFDRLKFRSKRKQPMIVDLTDARLHGMVADVLDVVLDKLAFDIGSMFVYDLVEGATLAHIEFFSVSKGLLIPHNVQLVMDVVQECKYLAHALVCNLIVIAKTKEVL